VLSWPRIHSCMFVTGGLTSSPTPTRSCVQVGIGGQEFSARAGRSGRTSGSRSRQSAASSLPAIDDLVEWYKLRGWSRSTMTESGGYERVAGYRTDPESVPNSAEAGGGRRRPPLGLGGKGQLARIWLLLTSSCWEVSVDQGGRHHCNGMLAAGGKGSLARRSCSASPGPIPNQRLP